MATDPRPAGAEGQGQEKELNNQYDAAIEAIAVALLKADRPNDDPYLNLVPDVGTNYPAWFVYKSLAIRFLVAWRVMKRLDP